MATLYPSKMSYYPSPVPAPAPSIPVDPTEDPNFEPKKQCCAFTWAIFCLIAYVLFAASCLIVIRTPSALAALKKVISAKQTILYMISAIFSAIFFVLILASPKYVGGNPKFHKLWPVIIAQLFWVAASFFSPGKQIIGPLLGAVISTLIIYFMYIRDDTNSSNNLCCKPWIYSQFHQFAPPPKKKVF